MNWKEYKNQLNIDGKFHEDWLILGIDLGTTNSVVSYWDINENKAVPVDASDGFGKIPLASVVQRRENNNSYEWIIGSEAYNSMSIYPDTTVRSVKGKMGMGELIQIGEDNYTPEELSGKIVTSLLESVLKVNPKGEVIGIVVTIPYDFDDSARKATLKALEYAGVKDKLICLMEEPKAASLAYSYKNEIQLDDKIMIFDFGGGTLDITILHVEEKDDTKIKMKVISEGGQSYHGGDNIDKIILNKLYDYIKEEKGEVISTLSNENISELMVKAIETKERLSGTKSYRIPFTFFVPPFIKTLKREDFQQLCKEFIDKTRDIIIKSLDDTTIGGLLPEEIDKIILEGGSSKMPWVKALLLEVFRDESKIYMSDKPALDISIGGTIYAAMKMGVFHHKDIETSQLKINFDTNIPHDIGVEINKNGKKAFHTMIKRGTPYKFAKKSQVFTLKGDNEEEMSKFKLKILERINKNDKIEKCSFVGEIEFLGLPIRPSGKTKLKITLKAKEDDGIISGDVEDLGYKDEFLPSGYKKEFQPQAYNKTILEV